MIDLIVFVSGKGSNLAAILEAIKNKKLEAQVKLVISDQRFAPAFVFCRRHQIPVAVCRSDEQILNLLKDYPVDLICLAGYMKILSPKIVKKYAGKIINIHPSLLPKYPGLKVHERVLAAQEKESGCTVHYVTEVLDAGPILAQKKVPVLPEDTVQTLKQRVHAAEHELYPEVLQQLALKLQPSWR